jgi:hypothetical protein
MKKTYVKMFATNAETRSLKKQSQSLKKKQRIKECKKSA